MTDAQTPPGGQKPGRLPEQNQVILVGRLTRDPDFRMTQKGQAMCRFDLAVNRRYQSKATGEWTEETAFVPVVAWRQVAEGCKERLLKGSPVRVEGRLRSREYEDRTGAKRKVLEVDVRKAEFLELVKASGEETPKPQDSGAVHEGPPASDGDENLEEVPF